MPSFIKYVPLSLSLFFLCELLIRTERCVWKQNRSKKVFIGAKNIFLWTLSLSVSVSHQIGSVNVKIGPIQAYNTYSPFPSYSLSFSLVRISSLLLYSCFISILSFLENVRSNVFALFLPLLLILFPLSYPLIPNPSYHPLWISPPPPAALPIHPKPCTYIHIQLDVSFFTLPSHTAR